MGPADHSGKSRLSANQVIAVALLVLFIPLSVLYARKANQDRSAFLRWRPQIQRLNDQDIYQRYSYPNPPVMAMILKPLTALPPMLGSLCWFYAKAVLTLVALFWVFRLVEEPGRPFPTWAKWAVLLLALRPIVSDLSHGNVNLFILFLVVAGLYAFHQGRDGWAGVMLALATACKVTPALFIPYLVWKRAWKALAGVAVGLVLFLVVVPGLYLGMGRNSQLLTSWYDCMVHPFVVDGKVTSEEINQSLPGLVFRLLTRSPSVIDYQGNASEYNNLTELNPVVIRWLLKGVMLGFAGLVVWSCRTASQPRQRWRLAAEFGLVVLGMLLFSERTWKHHCVTLLVPFAVLVYYIATQAARPGLRLYLLGTVLATVVLMLLTATPGTAEGWDHFGKAAQVYGAYTGAFVLMAAALVAVLRSPEDEQTAAAGERQPRSVAA